VDCDLFEVRVFCDAADLNGLVGLAERPNSDLMRMKPLWNWCKPSIGEVDFAWILGCNATSSGILCRAADRPVVVEEIHQGCCWLDSAHES
jgi:hypothetical protein